MKQLIPILMMMLLSFSATSQLNKNIWKASAFQFGAGLSDGANQAFLFHYGNTDLWRKWGIKPNSESWVNKWKLDADGNPIVGTERFWQSSRALVFTTDFHHASRFVENRCNEASLLTYAIGHGAKRKKWYWYLADLGIMFTARSAGFYGTYNIVFN